MAITVQRGPSMIDYGQAIAKASEKQAASQRVQQYGQYLAGVQSANQQYGLGLGNLGIAQQRVGIEQQRTGLSSRALDLKELLNNLSATELQFNMKNKTTLASASLLGAQAASTSSYANILRAMKM